MQPTSRIKYIFSGLSVIVGFHDDQKSSKKVKAAVVPQFDENYYPPAYKSQILL